MMENVPCRFIVTSYDCLGIDSLYQSLSKSANSCFRVRLVMSALILRLHHVLNFTIVFSIGSRTNLCRLGSRSTSLSVMVPHIAEKPIQGSPILGVSSFSHAFSCLPRDCPTSGVYMPIAFSTIGPLKMLGYLTHYFTIATKTS